VDSHLKPWTFSYFPESPPPAQASVLPSVHHLCPENDQHHSQTENAADLPATHHVGPERVQAQSDWTKVDFAPSSTVSTAAGGSTDKR
jgi:hypothetical protein